MFTRYKISFSGDVPEENPKEIWTKTPYDIDNVSERTIYTHDFILNTHEHKNFSEVQKFITARRETRKLYQDKKYAECLKTANKVFKNTKIKEISQSTSKKKILDILFYAGNSALFLQKYDQLKRYARDLTTSAPSDYRGYALRTHFYKIKKEWNLAGQHYIWALQRASDNLDKKYIKDAFDNTFPAKKQNK